MQRAPEQALVAILMVAAKLAALCMGAPFVTTTGFQTKAKVRGFDLFCDAQKSLGVFPALANAKRGQGTD